MPLSPFLTIIVIGASAGGIDALQRLFSALPQHLDAAVLVVVHQGQHTKSRLAGILQHTTSMVVADAVDGEALVHGRVYIAVSGHQLTIDADSVRVLRSPKEGLYRHCIDTLFRSASENHGAKVIGIVLSGMLCDGTHGLEGIALAGGMTIVQEPLEAQFAGMPTSAMARFRVDHCLCVAAIGDLLADLTTAP